MGVTARGTIQGALKLIGILDPAETMSPEDSADGLTMLNNLVDGWNLERLNIYTTSNVVASFSGASATIGPGQTINTARPVRIEGAFYRRSNIDYPIRIIDIDEYNSIPLKSTTGSYPEVMYYTGDSPTGTVYVWPVPTASNQYYIQLQTQLTAFADLDTLYTLPQGYAKGLMYSLAVEMAALFQKEVSASVARIQINMMRILKRANVVVPSLDLSLPDNTSRRIMAHNILTGM